MANLYLIGFRGSGKSTVAPLLAATLGWNVCDTDDLIEQANHISIAEIFEKSGESEFRFLESETLAGLAKRNELVVSLGGGAPMSTLNRKLIAESGKSVWLAGTADLLWERISADSFNQAQRPNLTEQGGLAEVESLLLVRNPVYEACADYTIAIEGLTPEEIVERIVAWLKSDDKNNGSSGHL